MRKLIENFIAAAFLLALPSAWGYALPGPIGNGDDQWQTLSVGYGYYDYVAPKDIHEEYRPVVPVQYYAADSTYLSYYGAGGMSNIDLAFGMLNGFMCGQTNTPVFLYSPTNGVTIAAFGQPGGQALAIRATNTLDSYSTDLTEFPLESSQINYTAQTLGILDISSLVLHSAVCQIGLASPDRYVWTLHDRMPDPLLKNPKCPQDEQYIVVMRNFDTAQNYSPYINGQLYGFYIYEDCGNHDAFPYDAVTRTSPLDSAGTKYSSVAGGGLKTAALGYGRFFTGLTRDDAAGLKYILSSNNINWEATAPSGGTLIVTNVGAAVPLVTSDLGALISASGTNDPVTLSALFPGLAAYGVATNYSLGYVTNYASYYTNYIGSPIGSPPVLVVVANVTPVLVTNYLNGFSNVHTNHYYPTTQAKIMTVTVTNQIGAPIGSPLKTNITYQTVTLNSPSGDYWLASGGGSNSLAGYVVKSVLYTNTLITSNLITSATNGIGSSTNTTSTNSFSFTQTSLTYGTNYWLLAQPVSVSAGSAVPNLRRGIGRVQFIRANYDSLLGQFFQPLTNYYSMVVISNSQPSTEYYQRIVTTPDFLFKAQDLTVPAPPQFPYGVDFNVILPNFDQSTIGALAGPGTIIPGGGMTLNKNENGISAVYGSLAYFNKSTNEFVNSDNLNQGLGAWGSFDGSTNAPVVYPNSASYNNLVNQVIIQVSPASLPDGYVPSGTNDGYYSIQFTAAGGQPPYVWDAPNVSSLVPGMSFDSPTATLSGTPAAPGDYTFTVQVTDSANRVVSFGYTITIH